VPPGPFSDRVFDAVGGCTRALCGAPDADAALDRADASTVGGLRAYGDRLALRRRFHDIATHQGHRPADEVPAQLFEALEAARLDALGAGWLPGIARNLLAHPGRDDDGVRWLAFEMFAGLDAPGSKATLVTALRDVLPPAMLDRLAALGESIAEQDRFASAAAAWAGAVASHVPPRAIEPHPPAEPPLPVRYVERYERAGVRDDSGAEDPPTDRPDARPGDEGGSGTAGGSHPGTGTGSSYRVYTTAHDRVVNAATLASREELAQLRAELDDELATVRSVVPRLAKRLLRVLMARQARQWRFDLDEGLLDGSRLAALIASPDAARPFKQEVESRFPGTVVSLLIDHSGSMSGRPMRIAALTVEIFARVLERCGVRCEVLGFTTREWDGGEPARMWAGHGYPADPGRLNALEHIVIKDADVPWRRGRAGLGLFLHDEMLKENIDGEAVAWAHGRLLARTEPRRILVVVSDGAPMDEATLAANGFDYLDNHLLSVIDGIEARSPVQLAAIGIGHDVSGFYRNASTIRSIDELGPALTRKLIGLLDDDTGEQPRRRRRTGASTR
jgi:cobaltochelatase CobT